MDAVIAQLLSITHTCTSQDLICQTLVPIHWMLSSIQFALKLAPQTVHQKLFSAKSQVSLKVVPSSRIVNISLSPTQSLELHIGVVPSDMELI